MEDNLASHRKAWDFSNLRTFLFAIRSVDGEQLNRPCQQDPNLIVTWRHSTARKSSEVPGFDAQQNSFGEGWALSGKFHS